MSAKVDPNEETIQMGVRIPKSLAGALDAEAKRLEAQHPGLRFTRSEVARAVLTRVLLLQAPVVVDPTPPKAEAPAPPPPARKAPAKPVVAPAPLTFEQTVIAALKDVEKAETGGTLVMEVAAVVRALEAQGHSRVDVHAELERLDKAGVLKLMPDAGGGNELKEDRPFCPVSIQGQTLSTVLWSKRPDDPSPEQDLSLIHI